MYLRQQWYDTRLEFDPAANNNNPKLKVENLTSIWIPDVFFGNEKGATFHDVTNINKLLFVHHDGRVWYVSK